MREIIPRHRFNSDGFCKDCGIAKSKADDPFCDGDDDPGALIDASHPAYGPTVAGYLAGVQYMAAIRKRPNAQVTGQPKAGPS